MPVNDFCVCTLSIRRDYHYYYHKYGACVFALSYVFLAEHMFVVLLPYLASNRRSVKTNGVSVCVCERERRGGGEGGIQKANEGEKI